MTKHVTHWIGGKPWDGVAGRHGDIYDPATGQVSGQVDFATPAEVDAAVAAAKDALRDWRRISLAKRASVLFEFRELVKANAKNLAQLCEERLGSKQYANIMMLGVAFQLGLIPVSAHAMAWAIKDTIRRDHRKINKREHRDGR